MPISRNLHMKSSEGSIKTRSTPASLSFKGQATKHTTVKWSIYQYSTEPSHRSVQFNGITPKLSIVPCWPKRRIERCSTRFRSGDRFWSQVSDTCHQTVREKNVGPYKPYATGPSLPHTSIHK